MAVMKLYNTLTRKKEAFKPQDPNRVKMYTCGMTVYDHTHIGHMRTYVNTDVLRRVLEFSGFKVKQVENVTDVGHLFGDRDTGEDKLEATARKVKKSAWDIARMYEKEFFDTMDALNVLEPTVVCRATEHIEEMIALVKRIEKNGFTYKTSDGVYFDTSKIKDYNKLSGMPLEKLKEGARVEKNPEKHNPTDFVLWKFSPKKGPRRQMEWDSPWGIGFPGWHIECSAMGIKYLGEQINIHTGGVDHIPIHHTNERAQNIAATGHSVVNLWFHNAFVLIEGQKMSKSLGNFFWMKDIEDRGFNPLALRYLFLTAHYRGEMNFTWAALDSAQRALDRLYAHVSAWDPPSREASEGQVPPSPGKSTGCAKYRQAFLKAINNDLDLPKALTIVWKLVKDEDHPTSAKHRTLLEMDKVLGLALSEIERVKIPQEVEKLAAERERLRKEENWREADEIRDELEQKGFRVEDTPEGPIIKRVGSGS
jgi:cysteinyl-tRNA synthetase